MGLPIGFGWVEPVSSGNVLSNFSHRKFTSDPSVVNWKSLPTVVYFEIIPLFISKYLGNGKWKITIDIPVVIGVRNLGGIGSPIAGFWLHDLVQTAQVIISTLYAIYIVNHTLDILRIILWVRIAFSFPNLTPSLIIMHAGVFVMSSLSMVQILVIEA